MTATAAKVQEAEADITAAAQRISTAISQARTAGLGPLDDLRQRIEAFGGEFAEVMKAYLARIAVGASTLEDFKRLFGDAVLQVEDGTATINELLQGVNIKGYQQQILGLLADIQRGRAAISDLVAFLEAQGGPVADQITGWVEAFQQGKLSVERFIALLQQAADAYGESTFESIADALSTAARRGQL